MKKKTWINEVWKNKWTYNIAGIWLIIRSLADANWDLPFALGVMLGSLSIGYIIMTIRWLVVRNKK